MAKKPARTETRLSRLAISQAAKGELRRGALARLCGCHIETIRFYEKEGILQDPRRTASGQRIYGQADVKRLLFVRRCRELGFTLDQVRNLLALVDGQAFTCAQVRDHALAHRQEVSRKIADLKKIEQVLGDLAAQCERAQDAAAPDCPIIETLFADQAGLAPDNKRRAGA